MNNEEDLVKKKTLAEISNIMQEYYGHNNV